MNQTQDFATESWPIGRPRAYPKNARKWSQKAVEKRWQNFTGREAVLEGDGRTFSAIEAERKEQCATA